MAEPAEFLEANTLLLPPEGLEGEVLPLFVHAAQGRTISCWRLSPDELAEIARTGVVWLSVWAGRSAPPALVSGRKADVLVRVLDS